MKVPSQEKGQNRRDLLYSLSLYSLSLFLFKLKRDASDTFIRYIHAAKVCGKRKEEEHEDEFLMLLHLLSLVPQVFSQTSLERQVLPSVIRLFLCMFCKIALLFFQHLHCLWSFAAKLLQSCFKESYPETNMTRRKKTYKM